MESFYGHKGRELLEKYRASSKIHKHAGIVGENREKSLKNFLREVLPSRFGITSGEVQSYIGQSKQVDIIIYDATMTNGYSIESGTKSIPGEYVKAIIEVKSKLSKAKLLQGVSNIQSVFGVVPPSHNILKKYEKPFAAIFAYELSNNSLKSLANNLNSMIDEKPGTPVNLVSVLSEGLLHFDHDYISFYYNKLYKAKYAAFPSKSTLQFFCETIKSQLLYE